MVDLDATALRRWSGACVATLAEHRHEIDTLNVFPVADADTGTNLLHTMRAADAALQEHGGADLPGAAAALARGALRGSRGNSGVILAQVLRGVARAGASAGERDALDAAGVRLALRLADELAVAAVSAPAPGTVLTVLHAAAVAGERDGLDGAAAVAGEAARAAAEALVLTTGQLPALAAAGVVDAGARGLVLLLEALADVLGAVVVRRPSAVPAPVPARRRPAAQVPRFEVTYLLDGAAEDAVAVLRRGLAGVGDSVTVAGGGGEHAVHVHCDDVGAALELGIGAGRLHRVDVTLLSEVDGPAPARAVLALADGPATAGLFAAEGATVARWDRGSAAALTRSMAGLGAASVTLLPNGVTSRDVVRDLVHDARARGSVVTVVPTASPLQGLAALAVHDPGREPEDDAVAMAEAAAGMRRGALRVATERALTWAGECEPGQALGLAGDEVVVLGDDGPAVLAALLDRLVDGGTELLTALVSPAADDALRAALVAHLRHAHPGVELVSYDGDTGGDLLLLGVE